MRQLIIGLMGLTLFSFIFSCQKEISLEFGEPAKGSLQSDAGECLPKLVAGSYIANKALNDSNFIEVTVNVVTPGAYTISTDTLEGFFFRATGAFTTAGTTTVRLKGSGKPENPGITTFEVSFDGSTCDVDVTVLPDGSTGGPAVFTLEGTPGACAAFDLAGNYYKDTTLDARHTIRLNVDVTTVGTYTVTTNSTNGYFFSRTGTFGATGPQTITLFGSGKPAAVGTNNFTVTAASSSCTFQVTVSTPATGGCTPAVQGTFTAGTVTTTANKVVVTYTYPSAGTYNVSTNTVNGYSFGPATVNATTGNVSTITLNATGTPAMAGTNSFTIDLGNGQTCNFNVTVNNGTTPANTDYFPTTQNSWWSYDDGAGSDTFKLTVNGAQTFSGNTYERFIYSTAAGNFDTAFYRKDAATGFYYESMDTAGFGAQGLTFNQARLNVLFLKNALVTNDTWNTDFPVTVTGIPVPVILRFKYTCTNANAALTVNGKNFTNVYRVVLQVQANIGGAGFTNAGPPLEYNYARGIGQIRFTNNTDYQEDIRNWVVN